MLPPPPPHRCTHHADMYYLAIITAGAYSEVATDASVSNTLRKQEQQENWRFAQVVQQKGPLL